MMNTILVTGANGQVGTALRRHAWPAGWEVHAVGRDTLDLTNTAAIADLMASRPWAAVVAAAAYTVVDQAEGDPVTAWAVNALAPAAFATACDQADITAGSGVDRLCLRWIEGGRLGGRRCDCVITGLYFFDNRVVGLARGLVPSSRGETEIIDLIRAYLDTGDLQLEQMGRGYAWLDTGTHDSLLETSEFVRTIQNRQGIQVAWPVGNRPQTRPHHRNAGAGARRGVGQDGL